MILNLWQHFCRQKIIFKKLFKNDAEFDFSRCKHNERTFWILCKYFGIRAYKCLLSVGISEGYFKFFLQNTPQIALSQCIYSGGYFQKTFWTFPKNSEFWVSIFGVLVQISEGIFKFSLKNHPNLPSPSANIMKGIFPFNKN